jgi:hypothetical protein
MNDVFLLLVRKKREMIFIKVLLKLDSESVEVGKPTSHFTNFKDLSRLNSRFNNINIIVFSHIDRPIMGAIDKHAILSLDFLVYTVSLRLVDDIRNVLNQRQSFSIQF